MPTAAPCTVHDWQYVRPPTVAGWYECRCGARAPMNDPQFDAIMAQRVADRRQAKAPQ